MQKGKTKSIKKNLDRMHIIFCCFD